MPGQQCAVPSPTKTFKKASQSLQWKGMFYVRTLGPGTLIISDVDTSWPGTPQCPKAILRSFRVENHTEEMGSIIHAVN